MRTATYVLMMTDRVQSTPQTARLTTPKIGEISEEHRQLMLEIYERWSGTEVKDTGDGYLVGFPSAGDAASAGLLLQRLVECRNAACWERLRFQLRIGLNVGDVVVAAAGDVRGTPVNVAARVESATLSGQVLMTEQVRSLLNENDFEIEDAGTHDLKGIGRCKLWRVVRELCEPPFRNPFLPLAEWRYPREFHGRQSVVDDIVGRLGNGMSVAVVGEKAIGKTWLLRYLAYRLEAISGDPHRVVYANLNSARLRTRRGLLDHLVEGLGLDEAEGLAEFEAALAGRFEAARRAVILLDPYERLADRREAFGDDVLESFRALGEDKRVVFVSASRETPADIGEQHGLISTFHARLNVVDLGGFTREEARDFAEVARPELQFTDDESEEILNAVRPRPLCLQIACFHAAAAKAQGAAVVDGLSEAAENPNFSGCTP